MLTAGAVSGEHVHNRARHGHSAELQDFAHGAPADPSESWQISAGGRLYDKWWAALDIDKPTTVHPAYPAFGKQQNGNSWRCIECHGWDYRGKNGQSGSGDHYTGVRGVDRARGWAPKRIEKLLRSAPHGYTPEMIPDEQLGWLALFISKGQHDVRRFIAPKILKARGNVGRGREIYQAVCASCHGYDGKAVNFGSSGQPSYVGTEANKNPYALLHRIRNSPAGTAMAGLRVFPMRDSIAVLAYVQTLPDK
jgi:mono/diheme cytochrome c family protein